MSKPSGRSGALVERGINLVIAGALALMSIFVFFNVIMRYFFHSGITWTEEVSRFLFIWLIFLGSIVAFKANEHLGIDALARRLSPGGRRVLFVVNSLIILVTLGLTLHGAWMLTMLNIDQSSPAINLPYAYVYSSGLVGVAGMMIIVLGNLYKLFTGRMKDDDLIMTVDTEELADPTLSGENK